MNALNKSPVFGREQSSSQFYDVDDLDEEQQLLAEIEAEEFLEVEVEEYDDEKGSGNRIMEFYLSQTQCEYPDCESLA